MGRLGKFVKLSSKERRALLEAVLGLGAARLVVLCLPFRRVSPYLGKHMAQSPTETAPEEREAATLVSWAVNTAARHLPWECWCLARAMTGKWMLNRRGVSSTVYLGLTRGEEKKLAAHAWLRSGDVVLTGAHEIERDRYTIISTFG